MNKILGILLVSLILFLAGCTSNPSADSSQTEVVVASAIATESHSQPTSTQPPIPTPTDVPANPTNEPTATQLPMAAPVVISSLEDLVGTWHKTTPSTYGGEIYRQFREDGSYRVAGSVAELDSKPRVIGKYGFEEQVLTLEDVSGDPPWDECVKSRQVARYEVQKLESGYIRFVKLEDECDGRSMILPQGVYELVQ
jgi:hypothetical protein